MPPRQVEAIPARELIREHHILEKFLKNLSANTLPTLQDENALKVTQVKNMMLQENVSAFREGRYEQYLAGKIQALNREIEESRRRLGMSE